MGKRDPLKLPRRKLAITVAVDAYGKSGELLALEIERRAQEQNLPARQVLEELIRQAAEQMTTNLAIAGKALRRSQLQAEIDGLESDEPGSGEVDAAGLDKGLP